MSPIFRFNDKSEATRVFESKAQLRGENARLEREVDKQDAANDRLRNKIRILETAFARIQEDVAGDNAAWRDLMTEHNALLAEVRRIREALMYRTKERDALLAGDTIDVDLNEVDNVLGLPLACALQANAMSADYIRYLKDRLAWVVEGHVEVSAAGRCTRCNVAAPCKIVRVCLGNEDPS